MFLQITQTTRVGTDHFYVGERRWFEPDDDAAGTLLDNGWAEREKVTLEVQSAKLGTQSRVG